MNDKSDPITPKELLLIFGFWTAIAVLTAAGRLAEPRGEAARMMPQAAPVILIFVESWTWALVTPLVFRLAGRFSPGRAGWGEMLLVLFAAGIVVSILVAGWLQFVRLEVIAPPRRGVTFAMLRRIGRYRALNQFLVYVAVVAAGFAREYFLRDRARDAETADLRMREERLRSQLAGAQLTALRMQINPHFLFNTLNAVSALVERDPAGARRMLARLSELLRLTLERSESDEMTVAREIDLLQRYLEIMRIRFQGRVEVDVRVEPGTEEALVPSLVLQPIAENAFEHGVAATPAGARVEISVVRRGGRLRLSVSDNGPGPSPGHEGIGLRNTRERLAALYGDAAQLSLARGPEGGAVAEIELPFRTTRPRFEEELDD